MKLIHYILNEPIHILKYIKKDVLITEFKIELLKTLKIYSDKDINKDTYIDIDNSYNKLYDIDVIKKQNNIIINKINESIKPINISELESQIQNINQSFDIKFSTTNDLIDVLNATIILLNGSFALSYLGMEEKKKILIEIMMI